MFRFKDSNYLTVPNHPDIKVGNGLKVENGSVFTVVDKVVTEATPSDTELYFAFNILDKPELLNTDDFVLEDGKDVRAYRMKDCVGLAFDASASVLDDMVNTYPTVNKGDTLVPVKTADDRLKLTSGAITTGGVGFKVIKKNTFGQFTHYLGKDVPGGFELEVVLG